MTAPAPDLQPPVGLRELVEALGLDALRPLLADLDAELAGFAVAAPAAPDRLAAQAHGLVGAAGGVGFMELALKCRDLEHACTDGDDVAVPLARAQAEATQARAVLAQLLAC